jgi:hypothetical protein
MFQMKAVGINKLYILMYIFFVRYVIFNKTDKHWFQLHIEKD